MKSVVSEAVSRLRSGRLVGLPTETVYGLAAAFNQPNAVEKIFKIKKRPFFDPLILHVSNIEQAKDLAQEWPLAAQALAEKFWPGPLTIVLPKKDSVSDMITASLPSVGIRCPRHQLALEVIDELGVAVAAPSANLFQQISPSSAKHVLDSFQTEDVYVVDGGDCEIGIESTVVSVSEEKIQILRPGFIGKTDIEDCLNRSSINLKIESQESKEAPGHMQTHYQPEKPLVILNSKVKMTNKLQNEIEKLLHLESSGPAVFVNLPKDPVIAARLLYSQIRDLSKKEASFLYLYKDHSENEAELWQSIWNRLDKAASLQK